MRNEKRTIQSANDAETRAAGYVEGTRAQPGTVITLDGPLGAGKTVFARGIAEGLGAEEWRGSPTFNLIHEYEGRLPLFHLDAYRITSAELLDLDTERLVEANGVIVIEWAQNVVRAASRLGTANKIRVRITDQGDSRREIEIQQ